MPRLRLATAFAAASVLLSPSQTAAQGTVLPETVVTATRVPTLVQRIPAGVTVIDRATIEARGYTTLAEALSAVPGLRLVSSGGLGGNASAFTRGTNSNHTLVLRDGIPLNDPSDAGGLFNFGVDTLGDVERIEVVRGPMSGLYGSGAIGGVVNLISRKPRGPAQGYASLSAGLPAAAQGSAGVSGRTGRFDYNLQAEARADRGFDNTPRRMRVHTGERDGYEGALGALELGVSPTDTTRVFLGLRARTARFGLDDTGSPAFDSRRYFGRDQNVQTRLGATGLFLDGAWETSATLAHTRSFRHYTQRLEALDPSQATSDNRFRGERTVLQWSNTVRLPDWGPTAENALRFGAEHVQDAARTSLDIASGGFSPFLSSVRASATSNAGHAGGQTTLFGRLTLTADARQQEARYGGSATTWRTGAVLAVPEAWSRLKLAYGTGFKAPSLFDLFGIDNYGYRGNPNLRPERSQGWEAGLAIDIPGASRPDLATLEVTYFDNQIRDLINTVFNASFTAATTQNVARARSQGVEASLTLRPAPWAEAVFAYTYTEARDQRTRARLLRRPQNQGSASLRLTPLPGLVIAPELTWSGPFRDFLIDDAGFPVGVGRAKPGAVVNISASYALTEKTTVFLDGRNLGGSRFEAANGFQMPGPRVMAGVRSKF
jgi:vitamin B12 transporter